MKTAISIPDDVFEQADRRAAELRISRSELYATAVRTFLAAEVGVTDQLNRVFADVESAPDPLMRAAARSVFEATEW